MCGRFTLITDLKTIAEIFGVPATLEAQPRYNIAPSQEVVAILHEGTRQMAWLRWGLIPSWAKEEAIGNRMINARAETLAEKPSFKRLLRSRRCLVVADGFYEWQQINGAKRPMYITLRDGSPFAFAGLWDQWSASDGRTLRTCTIVTTEPNELLATIHNRMPVILPREACERWLDPTLQATEALLPLLRPYPAAEMQARPVSRLVNDPRNEGAALLA
ncbi:SOS response-associated peptidase [Thermogemmatispora sp.]|uniref:SOS response-associated peptidase n=1 Tax=Thermogemmatispora sp. TaxID=1968838 RepID=UPI001D5A6AE0|nr:SOS response-associated peptidase [Thermogemmatispora sp.]MBX5449571.1 SOS response-associated peptidase [Thermogemmatispora sp.]